MIYSMPNHLFLFNEKLRELLTNWIDSQIEFDDQNRVFVSQYNEDPKSKPIDKEIV